MTSHSARRLTAVEMSVPWKSQNDFVRPAKAGGFGGRQSRQGNSQRPCSLDSREESNQGPEPYRQSHRTDGSESSGRSGSERRCSLEIVAAPKAQPVKPG